MGVRLLNAKLFGAAIGAFAAACLIGASLVTDAEAASASVGLGKAKPFAVLAGAGVTNTGPSVINGDLGTCPTPAITGFPPGTVNGTTHADDAVACGAQSDTTTAFNDAAGRAPTKTYGGTTDLGGATLVGGVYKTPTSFAITGTLTLDGQNDPNSVFIFQAGSTVITATSSSVSLINGAQACNVFWQVGSSGTLGVGSRFVGTMLALTSISADTNAIVAGRLLARNGSVTLDSNRVTRPACSTPPTTTSAPSSTTTSVVGATTSTTHATTTTSTPATTTTHPATTTTSHPTTTTTSGPTTTTSAVSTTTTSHPTTTTSTAPTTTRSHPTTTTSAVSTSTTLGPLDATTTTTRGPLQSTTTTPTGTGPRTLTSTTIVTTTVLGARLENGQTAGAGTSAGGSGLARTGGVSLWQPLAGLALLVAGFALRRSARELVTNSSA